MSTLTQAEIEERFAQIAMRSPEAPTPSDHAAIVAAETDEGMSLEDFKNQLEGYSGRLILRIPRSLHKKLKNEAEAEGVSLNQYLLYKLAN